MFLRDTWYHTLAHTAARIVIGAAYFTHGGQKLFGWFGASGPRLEPVEVLIAGLLETFGGAAIVLGLFTRPVAFLLSGQMAVAYFWRHAMRADPASLWWWDNRGELAMVFCFVWLLFSAIGAGRLSADAWLANRRGAATPERSDG